MSLSTTPVPARTDVPTPATATAATTPTISTRAARATGIAVSSGAALYAAGLFAFGPNPEGGWQGAAYNVTALVFQLGLVGLVSLQLRTAATGTGALARRLLHAEHGLLGLAILSTLSCIVAPGQDEEAWFLALDAFWPLSMLGMFAIGVRIAIAGRWQGAARFWPLVAESWAPVVVPLNAVFGNTVGGIAGGVHLLLGYAVLGVVLARRPELTGAQD